jgi:hypothetical protein
MQTVIDDADARSSHFVLDDGILTGIGKVHPMQCYKMQQLCIALHKCAAQSKFSKEAPGFPAYCHFGESSTLP